MAATDVEAMNAASVDSCVAMGDERTPLLQSPGPKSTGRGRQYSDSDGLINETATANCAYSACNQVPDNSAENGGEIIKFEGSQHCHRDQLASIQIDYSARRKLIVASIVCLAFMIGEFVGGFLANSLAIATDAAHLLTDFASFLISLLSLLLAARPATKRMSFGWYRAEVMGALLSVLLIWVVTGVLVYMAVQRVITEDYEIDATVMLITAALSVVFNLVMGLLLHDHGHSHGGISGGHSHGGTSGGHSHGGTSGGHSHGGTSGGHSHGGTSGGHSHGGASVQQNHSHFDDHSHRHASTGSEHADRASEETHLHSDDSPDMSTDADAVHIRLTEKETSDLKVEMADKRNINVRAAFIHVIGDLVQSFGVLIAAYIIYYKPEWKLADPICTFLFSILVLCTTLTIMKDILNVLMEGAPHGVSFNEAKKSLCSIRGVREVHNLRLWSLTVNKIALSAHLALDNTVSSREILGIASQLMRDRYGIYECTIQTEDYMDEMNDCIHCRDPAD